MNTQRYTVNVRVGGIGSPRVAVSQGDIGRHLVFNLFDGAVAFAMTSGTTATIVGRKPSGLGFTETCTLDGGNSVSVRTTEAMTQEAGKIPAELRISDGTKVIGTANFVFYVEPSPRPDGTTDGTLETMDDIQTQIGDLSDLTTSDKSSLVGAINEAAQSGGSEVVIDATLTQSGQAADAKATGDELSALKADLDSLGDGVPAEVRQALLTLFQSAAYAETGLTDEIAVVESWAAVVTAISLNQSSISISGASTNQLVATTTPAGGTVTWASSDTSVATVSSSGLVTGVGNGSCTITVSCGGKTATCSVTVSGFASLTGITATYTQSGTVYDTDTLDSLKSDLVVTATHSDSTTRTLSDSDYTLSGTLAEGTSTITVAYGGKTTTFNVTVTEAEIYSYSYANGDLVKLVASCTYAEGVGAYYTDSTDNKRRTFFRSSGENALLFKDSQNNYVPGEYYPIPIPHDATSVTVSITPNLNNIGVGFYTYDETTGVYTRVLDPGWAQGSYTNTFTAGEWDAITVTSKPRFNVAFTESDEPTELTIIFSR